jgi:hypothetical protein
MSLINLSPESQYCLNNHKVTLKTEVGKVYEKNQIKLLDKINLSELFYTNL